MRIYFLHHSAVAVILDKSAIVFDHFLCENKGLEFGSVGDEDIKKADAVYVFVSHSHFDHFNPAIFRWADINANTTYILDSTVPDSLNDLKLPEKSVVLKKGGSFDDGYLSAIEFGSTDIGGSFYFRCEGKSFFHAGDFNYWHWRDEGDEKYSRIMKVCFERELKRLREGVEGIDYAFFPLDSRIGSGYDEGAQIFIKTMKPKFFVPIHFQSFADTQTFAGKSFEGTKVLAVNKNGQRLI